MSAKLSLGQWLQACHDNCVRHAADATTQTFRDGWLEDAAYYEEAILRLKQKPSAGIVMTREEHMEIHKDLHRSLDLLLADFIMQNDGKFLTNTSLLELIEWSYAQTLEPTLPAGAAYPGGLPS